MNTQEKFIPAMYCGSFASQAAALAGANLPQGCTQKPEIIELVHGGKMLSFTMPPDSTHGDADKLVILTSDGSSACDVWLAIPELASSTIEQLTNEMEEFEGAGSGFKIFEILRV